MILRLNITSFLLAMVLLLACCDGKHSSSDFKPSGALPVLRIDTKSNRPVDSKDRWRSANMQIDGVSKEWDILIKGRGNTTWEWSEKKPYRIKLEESSAMLGLNESKHFVLLSEAAVPFAMISTILGFELSRRVGMDYTPEVKPVELVLNNDYQGLYLLTEQIRVEPNRINVKSWPRHNDWIDRGGWLLEIDGWNTYQRLTVNSRMGINISVEYHFPKTLKAWQREYINQLLARVDSAICVSDTMSVEWEKYVDIDAVAKFYLVNELMDNCEAFSGSCWLSRDAADTAKIKFGPVWDFGSAFSHRYIDRPDCFIYENVPKYCSPLWLSELVKFPRFRRRVRDYYTKFRKANGDQIDGFIDVFIEQVAEACISERNRWPNSPVAQLRKQGEFAKSYFRRKIKFLDSQWLYK